MFSNKIRVVKFRDESFKGKQGDMIAYKNATVLLGNEVLKLTVAKDIDLTAYTGKEINVEITIGSDKELKPKLTISKILQ